MIGTSVETDKFSTITFDERFRAEPPQNTSLLMNDAIDIVVSGDGTEVQATEWAPGENSISVEHTLDDIVKRCKVSAQRYPTSSRSHLNLGLALMRQSNTDEGISELELAVSLNDSDYVAVGSLAAAYFNAGMTDEAELSYKKMIEIFSESAAGYLGLASIALRRDQLEQAAQYLEKALDNDPNLANASYLLAVVNFKLNKPKKAISVFRKALANNGRSPELHQGLAIAYLLSGEPHRAERAFHTALALDPKLSSAAQGLALLLLHQERTDEAIELLSRQLERDPIIVETREILAQAFIGRGLFRQARMHLTAILSSVFSLSQRDRDQIAKLHNNIGYCLIKEGSFKEAEEALLAAIDESPRLGPGAFENLSRIYFSQGLFEKTILTIGRGAALGFHSHSLALLKEACLVNLGRYEDALSEMLRLIGESDAPAEVYAELGWLFCEWREDFQTATTILKTALEKWPENFLILNNLAYAHLMQGELSAARPLLSLIEEESPNEIYVKATRGLLALREGNIEDGERLYKEAESLAARQGNRELVAAVRQKRDLEVAREHLHLGNGDQALKFLEHGAALNTAPRWLAVRRQLLELKETITNRLES